MNSKSQRVFDALLQLSSNWRVAPHNLHFFRDVLETFDKDLAEMRVTGITLIATSKTLVLGPYEAALLEELTDLGRNHPATILSPSEAGELFLTRRPLPNQEQQPQDLPREDLEPLSKLLEPFRWSHQEQPHNPHHLIPSSSHYPGIQRALSQRLFESTGRSQFPRAELTRGPTKGYVEMRPHPPDADALMPQQQLDHLAAKMWQQRDQLSDSDADTLDAISAAFIRRARTPDDRVTVVLDDLLRFRGLKPKKGGNGRRGGYSVKQREQLLQCLLRIQDLWIDLAEVPVVDQAPGGGRRRQVAKIQSRAFVMTSRIGQERIDRSLDVYAIRLVAGDGLGRFLLGPGRQLALLSSKALEYNPRTYKFEKRLARYLAWQWRSGARQGNFVRTFKVRTLGEEIGIDLKPRHPNRTRDRLEQALTRLQEDQVLSGWQYKDWNEEALPRQNWLPIWLEAKLALEAPDVIKNAYATLDRSKSLPAPSEPKAKQLPPHWGDHLRKARTERGWTQIRLAQELEISQGWLAQLEKGRQKPSETLRGRADTWILGRP